MAVQITAWMASGLYFSLYPIEEIRGEHLTRRPDRVDTATFASLGTTHTVIEALDRHLSAAWTLESIGLSSVDKRGFWRISGTVDDVPFTRLVDADGRVAPMLTEQQAAETAVRWLRAEGRVDSVDWIETVAPGSEYRGGALPAWRVTFAEPEALRLYLDPWTAEIRARRTDRWRVFDLFWMLHVMDFVDRDDFNHPLLQVAAALGLVVALGGVLLWAMTSRLARRRIG